VHEHKQPFGSLQAINEETLAGGQRVTLEVAQTSHVLIIPITGAVRVGQTQEVLAMVNVEEMHLLTVPAGGTLYFANPYDTELITFLHLWIKVSQTAADASSRLFTFNCEDHPNQLVELKQLVPKVYRPVIELPFKVSIGRFGGRHETVYTLKKPTSQLFVFVLAGAFEVEGRLLHEKDGLALWDIQEVELEALSNEAVVVAIELDVS
jgi:redox-sensitive bicupin YhaK (pirin superfamily)